MTSYTDRMEDDVLEPRSQAGCFLLLIPVFLMIGMVFAYAGLFTAGIIGREATGDRVRIAFTACPEAKPMLQERVALMGLGRPELDEAPGGFVLTATMPDDSAVAARIPIALALPGRLEVRALDAAPTDPPVVPAERVESSTVHMGVDGAITLVRLDAPGATVLREYMQAHPEGSVAYWIDGVKADERTNLPAEARGSLEILAPPGDEMGQLRIAAERSVILEAGPLPCAVTVGAMNVVRPPH